MSTSRSRKAYAVVAPGKAAWIVFALIALSTPVALTGVFLARPQSWQGALWVTLPIALLIPAFLWAAMRRRAVEFDGSRLEVRATLYTRRIPQQEFDLDQARVIDLRERREYRPRWKTNGFSLPGYLAGNFRGQGGRRLFALLTSDERVLLLPLRDGTIVLLSVERPQALLDDLRRSNT